MGNPVGKELYACGIPIQTTYNNNLCFQKIAQVPDDNKQYNHHFRMYNAEDVNEEVLGFMRLAFDDEKSPLPGEI